MNEGENKGTHSISPHCSQWNAWIRPLMMVKIIVQLWKHSLLASDKV